MDKRKRVRFGCTLAPDVADYLAQMAVDFQMTRIAVLEMLVREEAEKQHLEMRDTDVPGKK